MSIQMILETNERIVAMCEYHNEIIVATERRVYRMRKDDLTDSYIFKPVLFEVAKCE